jgi:hypothetical protein
MMQDFPYTTNASIVSHATSLTSSSHQMHPTNGAEKTSASPERWSIE